MSNYCHHVAILTNHPRNLIQFYRDKLGFEVEETKTIPQDLTENIFGIPSPCTLTKLMIGRMILEIISPENLQLKKRSRDACGYNHWSLAVPDKKAFCRRIAERGGEVIKVARNGHSIFFARDPDGNLIEIYET